MVLALLAEPIAIHVWITIVKVWKPSLEGPFLWFQCWRRHLALGLLLALNEWFQSQFSGFLQVRIGIFGHKLGGSRKRSRSGSWYTWHNESWYTWHSGSVRGSVTIIDGSSLSGSSKFIFTCGRKVPTRAPSSTRSGHCDGGIGSSNERSKVAKVLLFVLLNRLADPLGLKLLEL